MKPKIYHPVEIERQIADFTTRPISAIDEFVQCFDQNGEQVFEVPRHVLEFLAQAFGAFMRNEVRSLDEAMGGSTARQRNSIAREEDAFEVAFMVNSFIREIEASSEIRKEFGAGTPSEIAYEKTAEILGIGVESVRLLYKKSKSG